MSSRLWGKADAARAQLDAAWHRLIAHLLAVRLARLRKVNAKSSEPR